MPDDVSVQGAEDFLALSKALKEAGRADLRKALNKEMRQAAKPLIADVRRAAVAGLPRRGGLGQFVAGKKARVTTRTGANPGVSVAIAKQDPRLDAGRLGHPVFNRRRANGKRVFVVQQVRPHIFSSAMETAGPQVRDAVIGALNDFIERVAAEVGHR